MGRLPSGRRVANSSLSFQHLRKYIGSCVVLALHYVAKTGRASTQFGEFTERWKFCFEHRWKFCL